MSWRAIPTVALGAVLALMSCSWSPTWQTTAIGKTSFEDAWTAVEDIAAIDGYPIDHAGTDRGLRVLRTKWRQRVMGFRGSERKRIHAEFDQGEEGEWFVRLCVERQNVPDMAKSADPEEEDWKSAGQDAETEQRLVAKLNMRFWGSPTRAGGSSSDGSR